jgi:hypothetical protein
LRGKQKVFLALFWTRQIRIHTFNQSVYGGIIAQFCHGNEHIMLPFGAESAQIQSPNDAPIMKISQHIMGQMGQA